MTRNLVAAGFHRHYKPAVANEIYSFLYIAGSQGPDHKAWAAVNHSIPDCPGRRRILHCP